MSLNEAIMTEFANGTGGAYFHNSNDLDGGLKSLIQVPEYLYVLDFSPSMQRPDDRFHALKVVVDRENTKVQARKGYFVPKPVKEERLSTESLSASARFNFRGG